MYGCGRNLLTYHPAYIVLRQTVAPSVIVEHGFHTSPEDVAHLKDNTYRDKLMEVECKGICDCLGVAYKAEEAKTNI